MNPNFPWIRDDLCTARFSLMFQEFLQYSKCHIVMQMQYTKNLNPRDNLNWLQHWLPIRSIYTERKYIIFHDTMKSLAAIQFVHG